MNIDAKTGQITLPDGFVFDSSLTRTDFESKDLHDPAKVRNPGTPWFYFPFAAGQIEGHPLQVTPCFYREVLVNFSFQIDLYPPGTKSWDDFSFATEEQMQIQHEALVRQWLGRPHKTTKVNAINREYPALRLVLHYDFAWGSVRCGHDERSGTTDVGVSFTANEEWARDDYKRHSTL